MKDVYWFFTTITLLVISGFLAINSIDGWGWFLIAAIIIAPYFGENDD